MFPTNSGHTWKEIEEFFIRDKFLNAQEAKEFGIIDEVMGDISDIVVLNKTELQVSLLPENGTKNRLKQ